MCCFSLAEKVAWNVTDDLSGIQGCSVEWVLDAANFKCSNMSYASGYLRSWKVLAENADGVSQSRVQRIETLPSNLMPGRFWISHLECWDRVGNRARLGQQELVELGLNLGTVSGGFGGPGGPVDIDKWPVDGGFVVVAPGVLPPPPVIIIDNQNDDDDDEKQQSSGGSSGLVTAVAAAVGLTLFLVLVGLLTWWHLRNEHVRRSNAKRGAEAAALHANPALFEYNAVAGVNEQLMVLRASRTADNTYAAFGSNASDTTGLTPYMYAQSPAGQNVYTALSGTQATYAQQPADGAYADLHGPRQLYGGVGIGGLEQPGYYYSQPSMPGATYDEMPGMPGQSFKLEAKSAYESADPSMHSYESPHAAWSDTSV